VRVLDAADLDELRVDVRQVQGVDFLDQCAWKCVFHAEKNADFLHNAVHLATGEFVQGRFASQEKCSAFAAEESVA
jgi:hypothetical protein